MALRLVTAAATELVTEAEARAWAKLSTDEPAWIVNMLIAAARERAEHICNRAFVSKTWDLYLDEFPAAELSLERSPVTSITHVKYTDTAGAEQTFSSSSYVLDSYDSPAFLIPAEGYEWPATYDTANAVRIRFVEGPGALPIPEANLLKQYICVRIATGNEFRQGIVAGMLPHQLPRDWCEGLLDPLVVYGA